MSCNYYPSCFIGGTKELRKGFLFLGAITRVGARKEREEREEVKAFCGASFRLSAGQIN
jgi:hypothetical protein